MKGLIGVPHTGVFYPQFVNSFFDLIKPNDTAYMDIGHSLVHHAREQLAKTMMEQGFDWLLFLDSDITLPPDALLKLLGLNKPIASGIAFKRYPPHDPCFYKELTMTEKGVQLKYFEDWPKTPFEAEAVGMACCLIRREVFEKLERPWFTIIPTTGEDISFCMRAKDAGFPIWIDPTVSAGHIVSAPITEAHYRGCRK